MPRTERQVMDLKNVPLRLLDRFPYLPGFCNWPHSALTSSLCTWLCKLYKLMTANQTQMAILMLLLLQLVLLVRVGECGILALYFFCWGGNCCYLLYILNNVQKKTCCPFRVCLSTVTRSTPAPILSTAMESASGLAVKHCVRTWDSSSSKLATTQKYNDAWCVGQVRIWKTCIGARHGCLHLHIL